MNQENQKPSGPLEALFQILTAITGIIALIAGILSACGFVLLRSHSNMLGLSSFLHHSVAEYVYEGGIFFIYTLFSAIPELLILTFYGWSFITAIFIFLLGKRSQVITGFFRKIATKFSIRELVQKRWPLRLCLLPGFFIILLCINQIWPSSEARDLLFSSGNQLEASRRAKPELMEELMTQYVLNLRYVFLSVFILWWIRRLYQVAQNKPPSTLLLVYKTFSASYAHQDRDEQHKIDFVSVIGNFLIYLLFIAELLSLPITYGQNVYVNEFHKVSELELTEKLDSKIPDSENRWLIKENPDSFILYFGDTRKVRFIPKSQILSMSISPRENIFKSQSTKKKIK